MLARFVSILAPAIAICAMTEMAQALPHAASELTESAAVYLRPYSAIPTGHYNTALLKKNLVGQDRVRWVFVKNSEGTTGWALKHQLLNPLNFSTRARLLAGSALFKERRDKVPTPELTPNQETTVNILEVESEWVLVFYKGQAVWTHIAHLFPIEKDAGYFFAKTAVSLSDAPQTKSRTLKKIPAGARLNPIEVKGKWVKVAFENQSGYVPTENIISRLDIAMKAKTAQGFEPSRRELLGQKVFGIIVNPLWMGSGAHHISLYEQPTLTAPVVAQLAPWQNLLQQDSVEQEWAVSFLKELGGNVWWENKSSDQLLKLTQLNLRDVKKIAINPVFSHLKIAAANGLYRSTDGVYWAPLREFQGHTPAFTFSKDGILFVEDKISFDNGEHFTHFVHWDNLLRSLRQNRLGVAQTLRILNIETLNSGSQQLILELDVGGSRPIKAHTVDRGQNWTILKI